MICIFCVFNIECKTFYRIGMNVSVTYCCDVPNENEFKHGIIQIIFKRFYSASTLGLFVYFLYV